MPSARRGADKVRVTSEEQTSGTVLMVRPASFDFHPEAAQSNAFARPDAGSDASAALREFDALAEALHSAGVEVLVLEDEREPPKPDAVFPNNWISLHADGTVVIYPMATHARRLERDPAAVTALLAAAGFTVRRVVDLSPLEADGRFLEGTGSLVLDRPNQRAFGNVSPRTDPQAVAAFGEQLGYSTLLFDARDRSGRPIYHANVVLSLGTRFAVLCTETVAANDAPRLKQQIEARGRTLIEVDYEQMRCFACNVIELKGRSGPLIALSQAARRSYRPDQLRELERFGELVEADIPTIESVGGGSVRCMIADVHLPRP